MTAPLEKQPVSISGAPTTPMAHALAGPNSQGGARKAGCVRHGPSSFYQARLWRLGCQVARHAPRPLLSGLLQILLRLYALTNSTRRRAVFNNFLPAVRGDRAMAHKLTWALFNQFAQKLTDLWRYESGLSIEYLFHDLHGWEHLCEAVARRQGVLLLTVHLGNWEFGAPLLTRRGLEVQVITLPEPEDAMTTMRSAARARWGVHTLALGQDPFGAIDIIRRLEENKCVALLMDRPPPATTGYVQLFGNRFAASTSAAELARATGCALLPVYLPRTPMGYSAHILPPVPYDRPALRNPSERLALTQRVIDSLGPAIRLHLDQWYHFVPIWTAPVNS